MPRPPSDRQVVEEFGIGIQARLHEIHRPLRLHDARERAHLAAAICNQRAAMAEPDPARKATFEREVLWLLEQLWRMDVRENALHNELPAVPLAMRAELES